ncbi:hypothetical protein RB653_008338 [Dictyostelium firmibasis]|uniref:Actin-like protein n=1 Tax=Dictyostelium firmibasis TaxID=79012 RepID=A0AAN7U064_9MYCE
MNNPIIIDIGTKNIRVGYGGEEKPNETLLNLIGRPTTIKMIGVERKDYYAGSDINFITKRNHRLSLTCPIKRGMVDNWDDMEKILTRTLYYELKISPEENEILLTEQPMTSKKDHNKLMEIMFETFCTLSVSLMDQSMLSFYSSTTVSSPFENNSGLVVDIGDSVTNIVPFYNGIPLKEGIIRQEFGGNDIVNNLNYHYNQFSIPMENLYDIKEKFGYVSTMNNNKNSKDNNNNNSYQVSDGQTIQISDSDRKECGEYLFKPVINCYEVLPSSSSSSSSSPLEAIDSLIIKSINNACLSVNDSYDNIKNKLYNNILLCGGTTNFKGLIERLKSELEKKEEQRSINIKNNYNDYSSWLGGSKISLNKSNFISLDSYRENGLE